MKMRWMLLLMIVVTLQLQLISSAVSDIKLVPWVNDFAGILTPGEINDLNNQITLLSQNTTIEIAIVTFKSNDSRVKDIEPVLFAAELGQANGVGNKDGDNGIVILWIEGPTKQESQGAIAVGRGIESVITDAKASEIGRDNRPYLEDQRYYEGFSSIIGAIGSEIDYSKTAETNTDETPIDIKSLLGIIFVVFIVMIIIRWFFGEDISDAVAIGGIAGGLGSGGSSGGSFSGGSFGGAGSRF